MLDTVMHYAGYFWCLAVPAGLALLVYRGLQMEKERS